MKKGYVFLILFALLSLASQSCLMMRTSDKVAEKQFGKKNITLFTHTLHIADRNSMAVLVPGMLSLVIFATPPCDRDSG